MSYQRTIIAPLQFHNTGYDNRSRMYTDVLCILCIITIGAHYINERLFSVNIYYVNYICWTILLITELVICRKMRIIIRQCVVVGILAINFLLGALQGEMTLGVGATELHTALFICLQYFMLFGLENGFKISKKQVCVVCNIILIMGVFASLYAMLRQYDNMIGVLLRRNIAVNGWRYKSFFVQRNSFACFCYLASMSGCYLYFSEKRIIYAICVALFGFQIFITNSRTSMFCYLILLFLCINSNTKRKIWLYLAMIIIVSIIISYTDLPNVILERLYHYNSSGEEVSGERMIMWMDCLKFIYDKAAFFSGFGIGTVGFFIMPKYGVGSAHNAYVDALFSGGIIYLAVMLYTLWSGYKRISDNRDDVFRSVFRACIISYLFYCVFESLASILTSNFFSVLVTVIVFLIPKLYTGETNDVR